VAADKGVREEALPATTLWERILGRKVSTRFLEDNSAAIRVIETGRNPSMRHISRTHGVALSFLHECLVNKHFTIEYCETRRMAADIFTKPFANAQKWTHACSLIGLFRPGQFWPKGCTPAKQMVAASEAAPATPADKAFPARRIVEFCCGDDSLIGRPNPSSKGCEVVRLTERDDVTTERGLQKALEAVSHPNVLLWASMPCTGGSPWQRLNVKRPGVAEKLEKHWATARLIWGAFEKTARRAVKMGGYRRH